MTLETYTKEEIMNAFLAYVNKYRLKEDEINAIKKRYSYADDPYTVITEMVDNYPDQFYLTLSFEWMEFCDQVLSQTLELHPEIFIECAVAAIKSMNTLPEVPGGLKSVRLQFDNYPYITPIKAIRAKHSNKFVCIEGIVRSVGKKETTYSEIAFKCKRCETVTYEPQGDDGKESVPQDCSSESCTGKPVFDYVPDLSTQRDFQIIEVEESLVGLNGQHPETIAVQLYDNLVGTAHAGDPVTVTGIVKDARKSAAQGKSNRYLSVIKANHVQTDGEMSYEIMEPDQMEEIMQLSSCGNVEDMLIQSLAPHIYGHENIKRALVLQMFSGTTYTSPSGNHIRGDTHICLMGDPGVAKSELCDCVKNIAPRSSFASGKGASGVGLTASASPDPMNEGQYMLVAGALPMADGGIAIIDEFDKVGESDKSTLHGAMEQQFLKIDKAGIHASLRTRCGILACANPKYGRFEDATSIQEQVDIPAPLLSRFDLLYIMRDIPEREQDGIVTRHMLESRRIGGLVNAGIELSEEDANLINPLVSQELFTRYIAYAKANIKPVLTEEATDVIYNFFVNIRGAHEVTSQVHISYRYLHGLARLAEASAKLHLRSEANADDARTAVEIMADALSIFSDKVTGLPTVDSIEVYAKQPERSIDGKLL